MESVWRLAPFMSLLVMLMAGLSVADESSPLDLNARGANETRSESGHEHHESANATEIQTLPIVLWKWEHVRPPYLVVLWVLVCWLCKLMIRANEKVTSIIPESALLIGFGWILGGIIWGADMAQTFSLPPYTFFYFLLPQIILDAGYSMPNKLMFTNMGAILTYAIIGTCWNAGTVGMALWGCHMGGAMGDIEVSLLQYLLYGSLLSAVDPVAVLAVFEEVHVNEVLFILVFGESLLNDGVTVVLFNVFDAFVSLGAARINAAEIVKGIVSFFVVAFGGSLVGLVFGVLTCLLTRCSKKVQIIEPGFVFVMGYLAYLTADMLSLSAILSITFCGVSCQKYINANMAENSVITVRHAMKVIANGSETIIFIFLGISAIDKTIWVWNTGFILLTVLFVLVFRVIGVFALTWVLNQFRLIPLEIIDQIIMSYGGLRGAVAYGLAMLLDDKKIKEKNLMLGTTLIVVYFTVILQGVTLKPLVTWLKVKRAALTELTLIEKVQNKVFDHMLVGIEDISGQIGHNYFRDKWYKFEDKWMTKVLMSTSARKNRDRFYNIYHQLNLKDATSYVAEAERRGSLDFFHNETAIVDFQKKFDDDYVEIMPDLMASDHMPVSSILRDNVPSVSLEMHERDREGMRETEDINTHHLLEEHLYKSRKQHRHRYSRNHFDINKDENEVQEIFQRTMRTRLESFKSAKTGVAPPNKMTKHSKKAQQLKMPNGKSMNINGNHSFGEEDLSGGENASSSDASGNSYQMIATYRAGAGIVNPAFMPEMDPTPPINVSPWLTNAGTDRTTVVTGDRQHLAHPRFRTQPDTLDTPASQGSKSNQPPSNHNKLPRS